MKKALALISIATVAVLSFGAIVLAQEPARPVEKPVYTPQQLLEQANALRAEKGVAPLELDERLNQSAQMKADDMVANNYYEHKNPVTGVRGYELVYLNTGELCSTASENLNASVTGYDPFDREMGWPDSKAHYEAIISERYDLTGFGYSERNGEGYYVQHFCDLK